MTSPKKLETLFGVLVLAFLFSFGWGCHLRLQSRAMEGGEGATLARKSLFRLGWEDITEQLSAPPVNPSEKLGSPRFLNWINQRTYKEIFLV